MIILSEAALFFCLHTVLFDNRFRHILRAVGYIIVKGNRRTIYRRDKITANFSALKSDEVMFLVIYADVLIIVNLYINFLLTKSTAIILRRRISPKRCLLTAAIGAAGSLVIMLPTLPVAVVILYKSALGLLMTFAAFGKQKPEDFIVCGLFFLVVSFAFGGLMTALWNFAAPAGMVYENGVPYFSIPVAALAAMAAAGYLIVKAIRYFSDKRIGCRELCRVEIRVNNAVVTLRGMQDTGCGLCDLFSGKPIIICRNDKAQTIIPENVRNYFNGNPESGIRLVPCKTVSSETLIPIFPADEITIDGKNAEALVGITQNPLGEGVDCVFNPKIISL